MGKKGAGPDPGSYNVSGKGIVAASQPTYSIGKSKRGGGPIKALHQVPGPGQYDLSSSYDGGRSIAKKLKGALDNSSNMGPGPGNYDVAGNRSKIAGGVFGVKAKKNEKADCNLGPGQYVILSDFDRS